MLSTALMESVVPAAVMGVVSIAVMATTLRWWRGRMQVDDAQDMRARIASAAPDPMLGLREAPAFRQVNPKKGDLATRTVLASSFVGRDRNAVPLE